MAIIASREVLPRAFSHRLGESPTAERKFVVTVDAPTATQDVIGAIGILHGADHPEFGYLKMTDASVSETDRHHVEISYRYELLKRDYEPNPLLRPDVWSFSTGGAAVPCWTYFDDDDQQLPLINTVGDIIESAMTEEAELRAVISGNRQTFPIDVAAYVTNTLNNAEYLGAPAYSWKCNSIGGQQTSEVVNGEELRYYQVTVELAYRQTGWRLVLPNVGWSVWDAAAQKKVQAYVFDPDNPAVKVPSSGPIALNQDGTPRFNPDKTGAGRPDLLVRRVHRAVAFETYFGAPQF